MDERIGQLVRNGRSIFYAVDLLGHYFEGYTAEGIEQSLKLRDAIHTAPAAVLAPVEE